MQRTMKRKFALILLFVFLPAMLVRFPELGALPRTIVVPNDYSTIQGAINAANNGDTIFVSAGRYYEGVIVNKSVSIIGESPDTTTVYGTVEGYQQNNVGNPFHISADSVVIQNFSIIQGDEYHGAIRASACRNPTIRNNFVSYDPHYGRYSGIGIAIENCTDFSITKNTIQGGGRIEIQSSLNGEISENTLTYLEYSILVYSSPNIRFLNNTISQCDEGIQLVDSANSVFSRNRISSVIGEISGISLSKSPGSMVSENEITNCTGGISISESSGSRLRNNHIAERNFFGWGGNLFSVVGYTLDDFALDIDSSNTIDAKPIYYLANLEGAKVDPSGYPNAGYLALVNCDNLIVEGFTLGNSSQGILLAKTTNSKIKNNTIFNSGDGIILETILRAT
jgi:parallel beta-helix repeat protein